MAKGPQMRGVHFGRGLGERLVFLQALRVSSGSDRHG